MTEWSHEAATLIPILCFLFAHLVIQSALNNRKKSNDIPGKLSSTNGNIGSSSDKSNALKPHEHEKRMSERVISNPNDEEDGIERTKVVVRVPATSANLGPGFDAIGMALDMWSEFTVERS